MKYLRKSVFSVALLMMPFIVFGQLLWSTKAEDPIKKVSLEQGIQKMMETYDLYGRYSTFFGYTHEQWLDLIDSTDTDLKQDWVEEFNKISGNDYKFSGSRSRDELTNGETALTVTITYIDAGYISRVYFSNDIGDESTYPYERNKFERWFRTFIDVNEGNWGDKVGTVADQGNVDSRVLYGNAGGGGGSSLQMSGWMWDSTPKPNDTSAETGKLVFQIVIDNTGNIIRVKTIECSVSPTLEKAYRDEVMKLTFSKTAGSSVANNSTGTITFIIKAL